MNLNNNNIMFLSFEEFIDAFPYYNEKELIKLRNFHNYTMTFMYCILLYFIVIIFTIISYENYQRLN